MKSAFVLDQGYRRPAVHLLSGLGPALVGAVLLSGCYGIREHLIGFPDREGATPSETADLMHEAVLGTEALIEDAAGGPSPGLRLLDAYVALGNDEIAPSTGLTPQGTGSRRVPLFLFPRSTSPFIAEASKVPGTPDAREWILPVILHREAFQHRSVLSGFLGAPLSALLVPKPPDELPPSGPALNEAVRNRLHFALVPRAEEDRTPIPLDESPDAFVVVAASEKFKTHREEFVLHRREDSLELLFRLPTEPVEARWKRLGGRREELFDLRVFPRLLLDDAPPGEWGDVVRAARGGRWSEMRRALEALRRSDEAPAAVPVREFEKALHRTAKELHYFAEMLKSVAARAEALAEALEKREPSRAALRDLEMTVADWIDDDPCPAPVLLDEPRPASFEFSFIVGADLQYHADGSNLFEFLAMIDPARTPRSGGEALPPPTLPQELQRDILAAKFVLIVGDFGDGQGFSSSGLAPVWDALGLTAPRSPYARRDEPKVGEFPELREQVRRSSKAVFAVPGNHDGFAAYGGVLNQATAGLGYLLQALPLTYFVGVWLTDDVSDRFPTIVRALRLTPPFYDGLVDWTYELGPRNVAFNYRGAAFVAANSFDLHQVDRDQVGAVGNNWGGGLQNASLVWIDVALRHFGNWRREARGLGSPPSPGPSFVFMHHDPRASIASAHDYSEQFFGHYNAISAPLSELTFGYLGMDWARYTGIYLPIISPLSNQVITAARRGENFQERWMRDTAWDETCHNARGLLDVINRNLEGAPEILRADRKPYPPARISHLFFGHDDVPVVGDWIQPVGKGVFPGQTSDQGWNTFDQHVKGVLSASQSPNAPAWGATMVFEDGRNAKVVRLDDLGDVTQKTNGHGFHLVTVSYPTDVNGKPEVRVRWIQIPR